MWKWLLTAIAAALIVILVLAMEIPRWISTPLFVHRTLQAGAKAILLVGYTRKKEGQRDAFGEAFKGLCPMKDLCGRFVFAEQKSCEEGGGWIIAQGSLDILDERVRPRQKEILAKIKSVNLPCLPAPKFNLLAVGDIEFEKPLDVWTVDDDKNLRALETSEP
jgi:hypothetical protein